MGWRAVRALEAGSRSWRLTGRTAAAAGRVNVVGTAEGSGVTVKYVTLFHRLQSAACDA